MRLLGVDYGRKRIGIAVCEAKHAVFSARPVLAASGDIERDAEAIMNYVKNEEAIAIVLGFPGNVESVLREGTEKTKWRNTVARGCFLLYQTLVERGIKVILFDESLTTVRADDRMREQGLKAAARRQRVDSEAAVALLESYVEAENLAR